MTINRRTFVGGALAGAGTVAASSVYTMGISANDAVESLIRSSFPNEYFDPRELADFASAAVRRHGPFSRGQVLAMENPLVWQLTDKLTDRDVRSEPEAIVTDFIRSSDILDPDRTGQSSYFRFADPYEVGCSNPLLGYSDAALDWPETVYS